MKRTIRFDRLLVAALAVAAVVAASEAAHAGPGEPPVPAEIAVEAGNTPFLVSDAVGVQIHTFVPNGAYPWSGGHAPAAGLCNAGTVGTTAEVPYTAVYALWKRAGS